MNKHRLQYELRVRNLRADDLCVALGISRSALSRKCNGKSEFTLSEIKETVKFLGLESPAPIFLIEKCPKRHERSRNATNFIWNYRKKKRNF